MKTRHELHTLYKSDTGMGVQEDDLDFECICGSSLYAIDSDHLEKALRYKVIRGESIEIPDYDYINWLEEKLSELI